MSVPSTVPVRIYVGFRWGTARGVGTRVRSGAKAGLGRTGEGRVRGEPLVSLEFYTYPVTAERNFRVLSTFTGVGESSVNVKGMGPATGWGVPEER